MFTIFFSIFLADDKISMHVFFFSCSIFLHARISPQRRRPSANFSSSKKRSMRGTHRTHVYTHVRIKSFLPFSAPISPSSCNACIHSFSSRPSSLCPLSPPFHPPPHLSLLPLPSSGQCPTPSKGMGRLGGRPDRGFQLCAHTARGGRYRGGGGGGGAAAIVWRLLVSALRLSWICCSFYLDGVCVCVCVCVSVCLLGVRHQAWQSGFVYV